MPVKPEPLTFRTSMMLARASLMSAWTSSMSTFACMASARGSCPVARVRLVTLRRRRVFRPVQPTVRRPQGSRGGLSFCLCSRGSWTPNKIQDVVWHQPIHLPLRPELIWQPEELCTMISWQEDNRLMSCPWLPAYFERNQLIV